MLKELKIVSHFNYSEKKKFNLDANIVASSFLQFLIEERFRADEFESIIMVLTNKLVGNEQVISDWLLRKQIIFDFDKHWKLMKNERQIFLLDLLRDQMCILSEEFNWNKQKISVAYEKVLLNSFKREAYWDKKVSIDEGYARVYFALIDDALDVFLVFFNAANEEAKRIKFASVWPDNYYLSKLLGDFDRKGDLLEIHSENGKFKVVFSALENRFDFYGEKPRWLTLAFL